jgi:hypothetical protein
MIRHEQNRTSTLEKAEFLLSLVGLFCSLPVNPHLQKYFCFSEMRISLYLMPSRPEEGRWPSSRTLGRDAVDAAAQGAQGDRRAG